MPETPVLAPFEMTHYDAARTLWAVTPGVGLSAADSAEGIATFLARNAGLSLVAVEEGALVGTILCGHDGRRGLIHHLVVAASHQRRGIGMRLLEAGLARLRDAGIARAHLLVYADNEAGLAFWRRVGIERTEITLFSVDTDAPM